MNMKKWLDDLKASDEKKTMPILSFPGTQLIGADVGQVCSDSELQVRMMKAVADRVDSLAAVGLMDLSVEAECFGAKVVKQPDDVPTIREALITDLETVKDLAVPEVGSARSGIYIEGVEKLLRAVQDRPVFAGCVGPFSLAGRLTDVSEAMILCYEDPDNMKLLLEKCTQFLISYVKAYKQIGAHGIVIAEPLAGVLSPALAEEFSEPYVRMLADAVKSDEFLVIYHNCGNAVNRMIPSILRTGCDAYHFGNAVDMREIMPQIPQEVVAMGNIDPVSAFKDGTPSQMRDEVFKLMGDLCGKYPNFVISSGCDIPAAAKWENIDAYFAAVREYYRSQK